MIVKVMAVMVLLVVAQIIPDCGGGDRSESDARPDILGWVDEKRTKVQETEPYLIVINSREYGVPYDFWRSVGVGDLVKFEGGVWTIVRKKAR